jgi:molybdopterin converting factor small subunit
MNDDTMVERDENLGNVPAIEDAGRAGIEVHESIDIESIELGSQDAGSIAGLGWEVVPTLQRQRSPILDDSDDLPLEPEEETHEEQTQRAVRQVADLEREELRLAADLAELRSAAATRERLLEGELAASRETVAALESELSEQVAQIASLTLECSGLRSQFRMQDVPTPVVGHVGAHTVRDEADTVARLKERLEERARAIAVAKAEAEELRQECLRLRGFLARRLAREPDFHGEVAKESRWNLRNLLGRSHEKTAAADAAAFAGEPGTEVPTVAIDRAPGPPSVQERTAAQTRVLHDARLDRRRQMLARAKARTKPQRGQSPPSLHRYLIALEPERDDVYELTRPRMYVGRGAEASLRLADATVSRLHGVLCLEGGEAFVEDASSTNGVFVNGKRVQRAALKDGDTVTFGTARYQYRIGPPPQQAN